MKKSKSHRPNPALTLLIAVISGCLIWTGCLIWINNSIAIIPFSGSKADLQSKVIYNSGADQSQKPPACLWAHGQTPGCHDGVILVPGNGDLDDNREPGFELPAIYGELIALKPKTACSNFSERRTVAAYCDFGHLKLMPADFRLTCQLDINLSKPKDHPLYGGMVFWFIDPALKLFPPVISPRPEMRDIYHPRRKMFNGLFYKYASPGFLSLELC